MLFSSQKNEKIGNGMNVLLLLKIIIPVLFVVLIIGFVILEIIKPKTKGYKLEDVEKVKLVREYADDTVVEKMDTVLFGSYPQSDASGNIKDPIEWIVLDRKDNKALLMSKYILDCKAYEHDKENAKFTYWEVCSLRKWLNEDFYNKAFNNEEKKKIMPTHLNNEPKRENEYGGNDTDDKIFCLNPNDAIEYFDQPELVADKEFNFHRSVAWSTNYAKAVDNFGHHLNIATEKEKFYKGSSEYWLRMITLGNHYAAVVCEDGVIYGNTDVSNKFTGIRPALWVEY